MVPVNVQVLIVNYRPFNDGAEVVNEVILVPERMHYQMGSLTVHDGMTLKIKKNPELAEDELTPGYLPNIAIEGEPLGCMKGKVGGQLILSAEKIYIESGGALRADSEPSYCVVDQSVEQKSINGASGGELHLFVRDLLIHGELSANGAPPQPQMFLMNEFYSTRMSGGAAGSIFLNSPNIVLKGEIITQGGSGRCEAIDSIESTECTNSPYSGGGPGREGGRPYNSNEEGGAGSGGRDYHSVNDNRTLGLIGLATGLEPTTSLRPADGNGICDGEIEYGPGTVHLFEGGTSCDSSLNSERASRLNHVRYRQFLSHLMKRVYPLLQTLFT